MTFIQIHRITFLGKFVHLACVDERRKNQVFRALVFSKVACAGMENRGDKDMSSGVTTPECEPQLCHFY